MCNTERYFVVGDNHRESLDRVVDALVEARELQQICLVPSISPATHLLIIANGDVEVQDALWRRAKSSFLPNLPVVVLLTDYMDVWEVCLDTALYEGVRNAV
jgi:hypothetical protein